MGSLKIENVRKSFGKVEVLKGIDLDVGDGEFVVFVGPSGCGKSTLLRIIAGLEDASSGQVRIDGADVCGKTGTSQVVGLPQDEQARRRKKIAAFHKDHALFACYAPARHPEIVVSVVAEHAGGGGAVAAPIARRILKAYFDGKKKDRPVEVAVRRQTAGQAGN